MNIQDFAQSLFEAIWIDADSEAMQTFIADPAELHGIAPGMSMSIADLETLIQAVHMYVTDPKVEVCQTLAEGDWCTVRVRMTGIGKASGDVIEILGMSMFRIENGKISGSYNTFDTLNFFIQIGLLPPNAFEQMLMGKSAA